MYKTRVFKRFKIVIESEHILNMGLKTHLVKITYLYVGGFAGQIW